MPFIGLPSKVNTLWGNDAVDGGNNEDDARQAKLENTEHGDKY